MTSSLNNLIIKPQSAMVKAEAAISRGHKLTSSSPSCSRKKMNENEVKIFHAESNTHIFRDELGVEIAHQHRCKGFVDTREMTGRILHARVKAQTKSPILLEIVVVVVLPHFRLRAFSASRHMVLAAFAPNLPHPIDGEGIITR